MRCPKCESGDLTTVSWEINYQKQWIVDGSLDDTKNSDTAHYGISPDADVTCDACHHEGPASTFQKEDHDENLIIDPFDELLLLEAEHVKAKREREKTHERPFRHVDELYHLEALVKIRELKTKDSNW
jgi:hypothetical protein